MAEYVGERGQSGVKVKKWNDTEAAKEMAQRYPYVLLRELSRVYLGETDRANIQWEEVTEARFFDDTSELRFWEQDGQLFAVQLEEEEEAEDTCMEQDYALAHDGNFGRTLTVVEYLAYDEDGQLYRAATRLKGWGK